MTDWIGDPTLSVEQKLARFEALGPEPTRGPVVDVKRMPFASPAGPVSCNQISGDVTFTAAPEFTQPTMPGAVPVAR